MSAGSGSLLESQDLRETSELWGKTAAAREEDPYQGWLDSPLVLEEYVQPLQTGSRSCNWLVGAVERMRLAREGHWLSLGCGAAGAEIFASKMGLFASMRAFDLSAGAIETARRAAATQGVSNIEFAVMDSNRPTLPEAAFDVAMMCMSLHHVGDLERCLSAVERSLRPGGALLVNDYVGPRRFQFTPLQLSLVRQLLALLPPRLRVQRGSPSLKTEYQVLPIAHWLAVDPSEAVRSDEILRVLAARFDIVFRADYGGTILNLLFEGIVHNFDPVREEDVTLVRLLSFLEQTLIDQGILSSDFTVLGLRRRTRRGSTSRWRAAAQRLRAQVTTNVPSQRPSPTFSHSQSARL